MPEWLYDWVVSPSPTRNWRPSGHQDLCYPSPAPHLPPPRAQTSRQPLRRCLFGAAPSPPHPPLRTQSPSPRPVPAGRTEGSRPGEGGSGGGCVCVSPGREEKREGRAGERGRESARRARRAGGRRILLPGARSLARSSLAGAASHLGRPTSADTLAAAALGEARTAPGGCAQWRLRPPGRCARARAPAGARGAPRSLSRAPRLRPPAQVTPPGARGGGGGGARGSPWWQRAPSACASPAAQAAAPAESRPPRTPAAACSPPGPRVPSGRRCLWRSPPPWIMHRNFRKWIFYVFLCFGVLYVKLG